MFSDYIKRILILPLPEGFPWEKERRLEETRRKEVNRKRNKIHKELLEDGFV